MDSVLGCLADCTDCLPKDPCAEVDDRGDSESHPTLPSWETEAEVESVRHPRPESAAGARVVRRGEEQQVVASSARKASGQVCSGEQEGLPLGLLNTAACVVRSRLYPLVCAVYVFRYMFCQL